MDDEAMSGRQIPDRDEAIATLFYACYPKLVRAGYSLAGDWAVAEEMAQQGVRAAVAPVALDPRSRDGAGVPVPDGRQPRQLSHPSPGHDAWLSTDPC
jgi:hypothetical protein